MVSIGDNELDIDYVVLSALLAGTLTAITMGVTLLSRPVIKLFSEQLPLPGFFQNKGDK